MSLKAIHDFELSLLAPCIAMSLRGVRIDNALRYKMISQLSEEMEPLRAELNGLVRPLLYRGMPRERLFYKSLLKPALIELASKYVQREKWPTKAALERFLAIKGDLWDFNPASDDQKKIVLYNLLKLPKKMKDKKITCDEAALKDLLAIDKSGIISKLLTITKHGTMRSILERIAPGPDGRLRTFYNPAGTETGRLSSAESFLVASTNLQNMPKKEAARSEKYNVRRCFVADPGYVLIEADLSQAEARVVAALSGDTDLLSLWNERSFDVHEFTAARIFGKEEKDVTETERHLGKVARHALNYGMQWKTFLANVNAEADRTGVSITAARAKRIVGGYHRLHPRLESWWKRVENTLDERGVLETVFGRRRTFFRRRSRASHLDDAAKEAIAFEPQSTVADLLNRGMLRWFEKHEGKFGELLLQVHDSVVIQTSTAKVKVAAKLLRDCLEEEIVINGIALTIPADVSVGSNWADMKRVA